MWETYKTVEQAFLPGGRDPGPWNGLTLLTALNKGLATQVANGQVRKLVMASKVSRPVLANVALHAAINSAALNNITQAGGGTLYDLNGRPVYYEVSMNRDLYEYVVKNSLYDADKQIAFASKNVIVLPYANGKSGALELKAAWKVLSAAEVKSRRFHTTLALLPGTLTPVTVGMVGFHVFLAGAGGQGVWATFAQVDNAPVQGAPGKGPYNFNNPNCSATQCPINVADSDPGQVVQITPDEQASFGLNAYMQSIIKTYNPTTPWQYYKIVNIQWPLQPVDISKQPAPANAPLPDGSPNSQTVVNAVLETFQQFPDTGCLACHTGATVASVGQNPPNYATSYSFMFGHATAPKK